jgi:cell wall-associated NlpC family hydrolase
LRRTRILLPLLVLFACVAARVPLADAAHGHHGGHAKHPKTHRVHGHPHHRHVVRHRHHQHRHPSRAARHRTRVAHERASIVRYARRFLGVPYVWGGTSPSGFDCSGFTRYVYAHFGVSLPHYTYSQFDRGRRVARAALEPGDLVFFDGVGHVGLYIGHNLFIHAPHTGTRVSVDRLSGWYSGVYAGARRLIA